MLNRIGFDLFDQLLNETENIGRDGLSVLVEMILEREFKRLTVLWIDHPTYIGLRLEDWLVDFWPMERNKQAKNAS
jgi:hypothetical protein